MSNSNGAIMAFRMSLTTVATSRAAGLYAAPAATTWLVSWMATPAHSPNDVSGRPTSRPMVG
jgi:hypothetical protein